MDHYENGKNAAMNIYALDHVDTYDVCSSSKVYTR